MKSSSIFTKSLLLILMLFFQSCANQHLGKTLVPGNYPDVSKSGRHFLELEHLVMDYACVVSEDDQSITFEGNIQFLRKGFSGGWEVAEICFTVYFLDINRKIIAVDYITLWPKKIAADKIPFKKTFKYNKEYKYVTYSYESKAYL